MNKKKAIEKINDLWSFTLEEEEPFNIDLINKRMVIEIISQIDEPQKVAVPRFVAEWIEEAKAEGYLLYTAFDLVDGNDRTFSWLFDGHGSNQETFARAWLDGYHKEEDKELWKHIPGFQNEVSNLGRVRSLTHTAGNGKVYQGKILKNILTKSGYLNVTLITGSDEERIAKRVHRLVAEAFCPNHDGKDEINHRDGNKENNRADNLEWVTRSENEQHAYDSNLINVLKGSKKPMAKLDEQDVLNIRKEYDEGCIQIELAEKYGVARQTISSIVNRKAWKHV